jgi:hypothetical protein
MKLPAAAYSAEVATSATKAGSYGVFGEGESTLPLLNSTCFLAQTPLTGCGKTCCGMQETQWPISCGQKLNITQDAQKGRPANRET